MIKLIKGEIIYVWIQKRQNEKPFFGLTRCDPCNISLISLIPFCGRIIAFPTKRSTQEPLLL